MTIIAGAYTTHIIRQRQGFPTKDIRKRTALPFWNPPNREDYMEQKPTPHDEQYFVMGNNKIIVKEHFKEDGKPLIAIVEKLILDAWKTPKNRMNTAKTD